MPIKTPIATPSAIPRGVLFRVTKVLMISRTFGIFISVSQDLPTLHSLLYPICAKCADGEQKSIQHRAATAAAGLTLASRTSERSMELIAKTRSHGARGPYQSMIPGYLSRPLCHNLQRHLHKRPSSHSYHLPETTLFCHLDCFCA
jgi:hypothetical protein